MKTLNEFIKSKEEELMEVLADIEHRRWGDWQRYLHQISEHNDDGTITITLENVRRWSRQFNTDYKDLSEREKQSDRDQVMRYLPLLSTAIKEAIENHWSNIEIEKDGLNSGNVSLLNSLEYLHLNYLTK